MAELFAAFLEIFDPKTKPGKIIWGVFAVLVLIVAVIELLGALGY